LETKGGGVGGGTIVVGIGIVHYTAEGITLFVIVGKVTTLFAS
jgi:hypothetical protein